MEIRDPIHGSIKILEEETPLIRHPFFQRLRNIKQLGFAEFVFPGACHTRFIHSIGVSAIGERAFEQIFLNKIIPPDYDRLKETFKLACLLHDIGHTPLSHSTEMAMPKLRELQLPKYILQKDGEQKATHEDYSIKIICDSSFSDTFSRVEETFGVSKQAVVALIDGDDSNLTYFTVEGINYFPILHQLLSSEIDCDRMDYLLRDSYFCGVSYGHYDLDWILENLEICTIDDHAYLGISEMAIVAFDDFLLSRYHMFIMVYFHYRSICLEQLLSRYFDTSPEEYFIPKDIENYIEHDDHHLVKIMRKSKNKYAQKIITNTIPPKIFEAFNDDQLKQLKIIQRYLEEENIEYMRCSTNGKISKYHDRSILHKNFNLYVVRKSFDLQKSYYSPIEQVTDLFKKFSKSHAVHRLHCSVSDLGKEKQNSLQKFLKNF